MLKWDELTEHKANLVGKRKKFDNNIYTFDIETTSYYIFKGKQCHAISYLNLSDKEKRESIPMACMYIWMFGINDKVYYGRTWDELIKFLRKLHELVPYKKYVFVHNLAFEFQFLKSIFDFTDVIARKKHKVMSAYLEEFDMIFKCTLFLSNCALDKLPKLFKLPVNKMVGDLDYSLERHSNTPLSEKEMGYCENDCLVLYHYIMYELNTYETVKNIPMTSTGKVRRELQDITRTDFKYKRIIRKAINIDPHVYNMLQDAFMGGYTHANWLYTGEIIKDVDSYDETSAYPYVMVTRKFPSTRFRKINISRANEMSKRLAYLIRVRFTHIESKYFNTFISSSKCSYIKGAEYDNGRLIKASEIEIVLTDIDFYFIMDTHTFASYEFIEVYFANYNYLPKVFINFILDKYENKTKYKDNPEFELEYQKEKNKFNALYGMSVTNTIRDDVIYDTDFKSWNEVELTNEDIIEKLEYEKNKAFLSFAYGVWVTAYARDNLLRRLIELDEYLVYTDTDSLKLKKGYDKSIIEKYNESVVARIDFVSDILHIDKERYMPKDIHGKPHMLGLFECETEDGREHTYDEFITQGAKKYAYKVDDKITITVSGVPKKKGSRGIKSLDEFNDGFVFKYEDTEKNILFYTENQTNFELTDYLGFKYTVKDRSGCSLMPTTYELSKSMDYANLLNDMSSKRARYKE